MGTVAARCGSALRCPWPIYEAVTGKPVAVILRPGKTPDGAEVALILRHLIKAIRRRWPKVEIVIRGDSNYARPEAMAWLERNQGRYIFGLAGNRVLLDRTAALAEDSRAIFRRGRPERIDQCPLCCAKDLIWQV